MATNVGPEYWGDRDVILWDDIARGYSGLKDDVHAARLFSAGWIEEYETAAQRNAIRDEFLSYALDQGYFHDVDDFDWDAWKRYMGYGDA